MWQLGWAIYGITVAGLTALVAHRKHRNTVGWLIAGLLTSLVALLLVLIAPPAGKPWGKRTYLAIAVFGSIALVIVLFFVALSKANFAY
ncbi:MAG: hypothetical protein ACTHKS_04360 [Gaiellaceae bacterium]